MIVLRPRHLQGIRGLGTNPPFSMGTHTLQTQVQSSHTAAMTPHVTTQVQQHVEQAVQQGTGPQVTPEVMAEINRPHTQTPDAAASECDCLVAKLADVATQHGAVLSAEQAASAHTTCVGDVAGFRQVLATTFGMSFFTLDSCRPFFQRRVVWASGAALVLAGVAGWALWKRKRR